MKTKYFIVKIIFVVILFCCLCIIYISFNNTSGLNSNTFFYKNGLVFKGTNNFAFTGSVTDTLDNNILKYHVIKGIKNGEFSVSKLDGSLRMKGNIRNNRNEGIWIYYFDNGQIECKGVFKKDLAENKWEYYYPNGKLKETGKYYKGKRIGEWILYDKYGRINERRFFRNGTASYSIKREKEISL